MERAKLPMSKLTEADRQELRALFSQLTDLQANEILKQLEHQPQQANALKQDLWGLQARLNDIHADANT
jgi:hypothetical protein